ncbi:DUF2283 domain-containing protein [Candidatus Aerophobetes bacterium]|nr:DUF2283 domain-containing protein [Candidatus Aerophobetes bacterium]
MRIEFDQEADALYVQIHETYVAHVKEIEEGVIIDFDEDRKIIGMEILDVTRRFPLKDLTNLNIENFPLRATAA